MLVSTFTFEISAIDEIEPAPVVLSFSLSSDFDTALSDENSARVSGLISSYGVSLEKSGTKLNLYGQTHGSPGVVKCGFKDLVVQRRATSSDSWKDYYDFGNLYVDATFANLSTTLSVAAGYQYRFTCKHYAKKSLLVTQTISNTSNIVIV